MNRYLKSLFLLSIFRIFVNTGAIAQFSFGGGFGYGTAIFINPAFARRPVLGLCADMSYMLQDSRIFPSVSYLTRDISVPARGTRVGDLEDVAKAHDIALKLNYRIGTEPHHSLVYAGIGLASITPATYLSDKQGNDVRLIDTGNTHLYPLAQVGAKYMKRILPNSGFYISFEGYLQYVHSLSQNTFYLQQGAIAAPANMGGDAILPGVEVKLEYVFGRGKEWD